MMKTTHAVEKTACVRQEFNTNDFESVQSKMDNFWEISGVSHLIFWFRIRFSLFVEFLPKS